MHVYPTELVSLVAKKWSLTSGDSPQSTPNEPGFLPQLPDLENLISTCYQVSMMREEGRPVKLRLILLDASVFPPGLGPPSGFQRQLFTKARPLNEYELRRLSPAVDFERSLIGVVQSPQKGFQIWGIINSGKRWLQSERGGSKQSNLLPDALVIQVNGPGMLTICRGRGVLCALNGGRVVDSSANVFQSVWMNKMFSSSRDQYIEQHEEARAQSMVPMARIGEEFIKSLEFELLKRIIAVTRMSGHGGTYLIFPADHPPELAGESPPILLKYTFQQDEVGQRQRHLYRRTIQIATTALGDPENPDKVIDWQDYVELRDKSFYDLEEAIYEQAQFIASLAAVDGAVVVSSRGAIGFGGMIVGSFDQLTEVAVATDPEGTMVTLEKIEGYGSRHRSVYHLCNALHHVMAIVVSQDGSIQLTKWRNGIVTCWDLTSTTFISEN